MLNVFESLKWKAKIWFENPDCKFLKFGLPRGKFWLLSTLWCNLHMFVEILNVEVENKENAYMSTKQLSEKSEEKKLKTKKKIKTTTFFDGFCGQK